MPTETLTAREIGAIEEFRLQRRWSYRELAEDFTTRTGIDMPEITLYKALAEPRRRLRATTIHPIRRYLSAIAQVEAEQR